MFKFSFDSQDVKLTIAQDNLSLLKKILRSANRLNLAALTEFDRDLIIAIADLRELADRFSEKLVIESNKIIVSHKIVACLDAKVAETLGIPKTVDFVLRTDVEGLVGSKNFRLKAEWFKNGLREFPKRTGCILETSSGLQRLPLWVMEALEIAESYSSGAGDISDWSALARFRKALDPSIQLSDLSSSNCASMTEFLSKLQVQIADRFSIAPNTETNNFEVIPFSGDFDEKRLDKENIEEKDSAISGNELLEFQMKLRERGALPAYRLGSNSFLVIDKSVIPVLKVMHKMQRAPADIRSLFIKNPRPQITEAIYDYLKESGRLNGLSKDAEQELIELIAEPSFVETKEYISRVTGVSIFQKPDFDEFRSSGIVWFPESLQQKILEVLVNKTLEQLKKIKSEIERAIELRKYNLNIDGITIPASQTYIDLLSKLILAYEQKLVGATEPKPTIDPSRPIVLSGVLNIDETQWSPQVRARSTISTAAIPELIKTRLKPHQVESFYWQVASWKAGLPGILNADEQGLGKTLQTLAFLVWLKKHLSENPENKSGPFLIVAPTSLLKNWEQEVENHLKAPGLGQLIRLYGGAISNRKREGHSGIDIETGDTKLDFETIFNAINEGVAHQYWILTTYTTLTNFQHSLAKIPFSAIVFDEIQMLKNPASLRSNAALFMNGEFRIGLTGTPIENSSTDLWAIIEQIFAGFLGSYNQFNARYGIPNQNNMSELYDRVFKPNYTGQPIGLRRLKRDVAQDLPEKNRYLYPRLMPIQQASVYDKARLDLVGGGLGATLKALQHIRAVSVHPLLDEGLVGEDFIKLSARLIVVFEILRKIRANREKALVFIETRKMQYRFIELARAEFGLNHIDLINGDTPIAKRQDIVNRFQKHLYNDKGFDILVLGPKAAGVGLTLTAATHVIHLSRWWNPAVEEQCNDRTHRIGQKQSVSVHIPMAIHSEFQEHSFDCLLQSLMQRKRRLAESALWPMGNTDDDAAMLQRMLGHLPREARGDVLQATVDAVFLRDGLPQVKISSEGFVRLP